jgi:periplasmic divalent cation tolerance protein
MTDRALLAISTFSDAETARSIANQLVTERFAACANIVPAIESIYRWNEKVETAAEIMVLFKVSEDRFRAFEEKLLSLHPYDVPEVICLKVDQGAPEYLRWVSESCR